MELVVDTNILFSFFRENPVRRLIINSKSFNLKLYSSEYALEELRENKFDLLKYSKLKSDKELDFVIAALNSFIEIKPLTFFEELKQKALQISHDPKDAPFFALALKLNSGIWSNEPRLKRQDFLKVFSTSDLRKLLNF